MERRDKIDMKCQKITVSKIQNTKVLKTVTVEDALTKIPKDITYETYEWQAVQGQENNLVLPANSQTLEILARLASTVGVNPVSKAPDGNIRYEVKVIETVENVEPDVKELEVLHMCNCGKIIPVETPPKDGKIYSVNCPVCQIKVLEHGGRR